MSISKLWVPAVCVSLLAACGNKPDVGVIEADLVAAWSQCKGLKVSGLKKLSGEKTEEAYSMNFSYNLELLVDDVDQACAGNPENVVKLANVMLANNRALKDVKKGDVVTVNGAVNLIKSENGWVLQ
jgi:hypothetical protein